MKVLMIDDWPHPKNLFKYIEQLYPEWHVYVSKSFTDTKKCLQKNKYDIILLDHDFSGWRDVKEGDTGREIFQKIRLGWYGEKNMETEIISISALKIDYCDDIIGYKRRKRD
ncbi:MAG: hypothetical protein PF549_04965 [Patescibacteria group bacterium]|nr:hypothetical protein [Patescibacteria group bacterium]